MGNALGYYLWCSDDKQWIVCGQVFDFTLETEEMSSITALNRNWRYIVPTITVSSMHPHIPYLQSICSKPLCHSCIHICIFLHLCISLLGGWEARTKGCRTSPLSFQWPILRFSAGSCCALKTTYILSSCLPSSSDVLHKIKFLLCPVSMVLLCFSIMVLLCYRLLSYSATMVSK